MSSQIPDTERASLGRTAILYSLFLLVAILGFFAIRHFGETLTAPAPLAQGTANGKSAPPNAEALLPLLFALLAVIVIGQVIAKLFSYIGQPAVIGEVVAGILLGPSLMGSEWSQKILPQNVAPYLSILAQIGVILYMFLVGLELNGEMIRRRAHSTIAISHASIVFPFILGAALALWLYPHVSSSDVSFTNFALFLGIAMSITAFPVLARILTDRRMTNTELGAIALSCAATDDATAWCLLAFVVGVTKADVGNSLWVIAGALAFISFMLFVIRPILKRRIGTANGSPLAKPVVVFVYISILLSALTTEFIGIHAIFGAFLLGAIIPHQSEIARRFTTDLRDVVTILLLPAFFAFTGMRTRIDLLGAGPEWLFCAAIILVATVGKLGGTLFAARTTGLEWRSAIILGTLMNTRGLMELIILNIGLDLKVVSTSLYTMMVIMALITTMATSPILAVLCPETASDRKW